MATKGRKIRAVSRPTIGQLMLVAINRELKFNALQPQMVRLPISAKVIYITYMVHVETMIFIMVSMFTKLSRHIKEDS